MNQKLLRHGPSMAWRVGKNWDVKKLDFLDQHYQKDAKKSGFH